MNYIERLQKCFGFYFDPDDIKRVEKFLIPYTDDLDVVKENGKQTDEILYTIFTNLCKLSQRTLYNHCEKNTSIEERVKLVMDRLEIQPINTTYKIFVLPTPVFQYKTYCCKKYYYEALILFDLNEINVVINK